MDNFAIADNFSLLAKLVDIHGDDSFKAKSYSSAAFTIEKLPVQLASMDPAKIFTIKGIGQSSGKRIMEQLETGRLALLDEYISKTPPGILEMMNIKGLGPKKITTIWKELGVESLGELLYACNENRLLLYKGFGAKTQQSIKESIEFYMGNLGSYLFAQIEEYANSYTQKMEMAFPGNKWLPAGQFNRHMEIISKLEWVTDADTKALKSFFETEQYTVEIKNDTLEAKGPENVLLVFYIAPAEKLATRLFELNGSDDFIRGWHGKFGWDKDAIYESEEKIFSHYGLKFIPPFLREDEHIISKAANGNLPEVIQPKDIRGIIHTHSNWSDGVNTIEMMANAAIELGFEYLVISDHSQSAFYANGLFPDRVKEQHASIDELNAKLAPFKIFKSIESDILYDGNLDYEDEILASFDLVIASVHSVLKMSEEKAMSRLLKAIANPYTTILGHMTGRLLLSRNGYPVNHEEIIQACADHNVVIELNAHARRLDMDWRYIPKAIEKGVLISINPDSHSADSFLDIRNGVIAAQKGGLTKANNLSSFTLQEFEEFLVNQRKKRSGS